MKRRALYEPFQTHIDIDGRRYEIRPSWDRVIEAYDVMGDPDTLPAVKIEYVSSLFFWEAPNDPKAAVDQVFKMLEMRGDDPEEKKDSAKKNTAAKPPIFDFKQDAPYFYGAFWQAYGVRLSDWMDTRSRPRQRTQWMHWHEFLYLFQALPDSVRLTEIMTIRETPLPTVTPHNKDYVERLAANKATFALDIDTKRAQAQFKSGAWQLFQYLSGRARGN